MDKEYNVMSFSTAIDMANWINKHIPNPIIQEQLMMQGIRNKELNNSYEIKVRQRKNVLSFFAQTKFTSWYQVKPDADGEH